MSKAKLWSWPTTIVHLPEPVSKKMHSWTTQKHWHSTKLSWTTCGARAKESEALVDEVETLTIYGARANDSWDVARYSTRLTNLTIIQDPSYRVGTSND